MSEAIVQIEHLDCGVIRMNGITYYPEHFYLSQCSQARADGVEEGTKIHKCVIEPDKSNWISTKERLPQLKKRVLIHSGSELLDIVAELINDSDYGTVWYDNDEYFALESVSHWMPLPVPPEK